MSGAAALDPSLVPAGLRTLDLEALAAEHGTPLFVYSEEELRTRCRAYLACFGSDHVAYASKAFLCTAMVRLAAEEGLHLDVATAGELHVATRAGFPARRIVLHGNNKSDEELETACSLGVGRVVLDSFDELARLERIVGPNGPAILVRVTPGVEAHTHEFIETGTEASKFGFTVAHGVALEAIMRVVKHPVLRFAGIHCHIGSQIQRLDAFARAIEKLAALAAEVKDACGVPIEELNLGGGLAARYLAEDPWVEPAAYAHVIHEAVRTTWAAQRLDDGPSVMVEPGRSIAGPAGITIYRVGTIKEIPGVGTYVAVDGGMSDNPRPVLYGAGYEAYLPRAFEAPRPLACTIVGKHCEQGDVLVADARLPADVHVGDLLATPCTGAYGYAMASTYNKVPRPAVVFVSGGRARVVIRRETFDDLVRLDES